VKLFWTEAAIISVGGVGAAAKASMPWRHKTVVEAERKKDPLLQFWTAARYVFLERAATATTSSAPSFRACAATCGCREAAGCVPLDSQSQISSRWRGAFNAS